MLKIYILKVTCNESWELRGNGMGTKHRVTSLGQMVSYLKIFALVEIIV